MKQHQLLITLSIFLFFSFYNLPSIKAQIDPNSKEFVATIDSIFADKTDLTVPGASVIIMKGKELVLSKNYGSANLSFGVPFNENTVFPLTSFSEHLVVFSILQLDRKGLLKLSDPVNKYLPELGFTNQVSLSHLLNHSSGLPVIGSLRLMAGWNFTDPFYQHDFLNLTKKITKDLKPDINYQHSHSGIKFLQMVLEKISQMNFSEYAAVNIFQPLGMTNSVIKNEHYQKTKNNSLGYSQTDAGFQRTHSTEYAAMSPTIYSTQNDFKKWMLNVQTKKFEGSIIEQMDQALTLNGKLQKRTNRSYCIGQQQYYKVLEQDEFYFMDTGEGHSWKWARLKQSDFSIMVVGNLETYIGTKVNEIERLLIPQKSESSTAEESESKPIKLSEKELQSYTGFFWDSNYLFTTQISIKDGALYYEDLDNGWNFSLTPLSKSLFESPPWNEVEITNLNGQKKLNLMLRDGREFPSEEYDPKVILPKDYPKYAGIYTSDKLNAFYQLIVVDNKLILKRSRKPDLELTPIGKNKFRTMEIDFRLIEFKEDNKNSIYEMNISNTGLKNVEFRKL